MADNEREAADFMMTLADRTGVAISSVKDGYVMVFTKGHLEGLLQAVVASGQDKCVVFVKKPGPAN